jgi:dTDP-glucose 4,6-dehydratase
LRLEQIVLRGRDDETYNVGSDREASIDEFADLVLDTLGKPHSLKTIVPDRPGHDRRYLLDSTKLRRELGWEPQIEFGSGLRATVEWYAANRAWWEPLRDRAPVVETAWSAGPAPAR